MRIWTWEKQVTEAVIDIIDVHHHYVPRFYRDLVADEMHSALPGGAKGGGALPIPDWELGSALEKMDMLGIRTGMLSVAGPGRIRSDAGQTAALCRQLNEFGAQLVRDRPQRFGLFASLPLVDIDSALEEIEYSLDVLGADGICLPSNYGGEYLGSSRLRPVFSELDRRAAIAFVHPELPKQFPMVEPFGPGVLEFPFDTTRAMLSLISAGVPQTFCRLRFLLSHAGGALPYMLGRIAVFSNEDWTRVLPPGSAGGSEAIRSILAQFYYDLCNKVDAATVAALAAICDESHLMFGTDMPFGDGPDGRWSKGCIHDIRQVGLNDPDGVLAGNAVRLFPRLASPHQ
jgi:predicted TIM-barrel fold metal-dependent hydrolase